tara:strand:- start:977 stop:1573 length:597 start_codon:yes stop_codon:yes gene_type:complete
MLKKIIMVLLLGIGVNTASANQYYVGLDFNEIEVNTGIKNISSNLDEEDTILKFTGGYKLDDKISLEAFYLDFGEASLSGVSGNRFSYGGSTYEFNQTAKIALTVDTIGIGARYNIFNEGKSALYGIAGIHSYDVTLSVASGTGSASVTETGNDPYFGVGYNYLVADGIKLNISYQNYEFDNDSIDGFLFGIQYDFKD